MTKDIIFDIEHGFLTNAQNNNKIIVKSEDNKGSRSFKIYLNKDGSILDLTGVRVMVAGKGVHGEAILEDCAIKDASRGLIEYTPSTEIQSDPGITELEFLLHKNGVEISTAVFKMEIKKSARDSEVILSSPKYETLVKGLMKLDQWDKIFTDTSNKIEEKYTPRLQNLDEKIDTNINRVDAQLTQKVSKNNATVNKKLKLVESDASNKAAIGWDEETRDTYIANSKENPDWFRLKEDGTITYGGKRVYSEKDKPTELIKLDIKDNVIKNQSANLAKTYKKIVENKPFKICLYGDSLIYGMDTVSTDKRPSSITFPDGTTTTTTIGAKTIPEVLKSNLTAVYGDVSIENRSCPGDWVSRGLERFKVKENPSNADIVVIEYGVNDSRHSSCPYKGDVVKFLSYYRELIELEIQTGSSIVILSPFKMKVSDDVNVQAFEIALNELANEYGIKVIQGDELIANLPYNYYSDSTHLNGAGYEILASRLASCFIGSGIFENKTVHANTQLLTRKQLDYIFYRENGLVSRVSASSYSTPCEKDESGGIALVLAKDGKVYYSFYAETDFYIVPFLSLNDSNSKARIALDFGVKNGDNTFDDYPNFENVVTTNDESNNMTYIDYTKAMINNNTKIFIKQILDYNLPVLRLVKKGWHNICISSQEGNVGFGGIVFLDINYFRNITKYGGTLERSIGIKPVVNTDFTSFNTERNDPKNTANKYIAHTGLYQKTEGLAACLALTKNGEEINRVQVGETFIESIKDNFTTLGRSGVRFKDIYCINGVINTSDRRLKKDITEIDLGLDFIKKLNPVSYKFVDGQNERTHMGLVAQDVEEILSEDKALLIKDRYIDEETEEEKVLYGLRYTELIAPMIKAIKELELEIKLLKGRQL